MHNMVAIICVRRLVYTRKCVSYDPKEDEPASANQSSTYKMSTTQMKRAKKLFAFCIH